MTENSYKTDKKASKQKNHAAPKQEKLTRKSVPLILVKGDSEEVAALKFAKLATSPELAACRAITASESKTIIGEEIDVPSMLKHLQKQAEAVNRGDLAQAEAMLMNQATALQSLFVRLTERGVEQTHMPNLEGFMRLALRAQSQCRATLETLAAIKNPPIVYARQANVTTGPQQINNGTVASLRARENENQQSKLMEVDNGQRMDTGTARTTSGTNKAMATVGEINRAENGKR